MITGYWTPRRKPGEGIEQSVRVSVRKCQAHKLSVHFSGSVLDGLISKESRKVRMITGYDTV
jgi:hypothetical protein